MERRQAMVDIFATLGNSGPVVSQFRSSWHERFTEPELT